MTWYAGANSTNNGSLGWVFQAGSSGVQNVYLGANNALTFYVGSTPVTAIYYGSTKVWAN